MSSEEHRVHLHDLVGLLPCGVTFLQAIFVADHVFFVTHVCFSLIHLLVKTFYEFAVFNENQGARRVSWWSGWPCLVRVTFIWFTDFFFDILVFFLLSIRWLRFFTDSLSLMRIEELRECNLMVWWPCHAGPRSCSSSWCWGKLQVCVRRLIGASWSIPGNGAALLSNWTWLIAAHRLYREEICHSSRRRLRAHGGGCYGVRRVTLKGMVSRGSGWRHVPLSQASVSRSLCVTIVHESASVETKRCRSKWSLLDEQTWISRENEEKYKVVSLNKLSCPLPLTFHFLLSTRICP